MKTLVVLSALVSLAFAAPSTPGEGLKDRSPDWHYQAQPGLTDIVKREKKSPLDTTTILHNDATVIEDIDTGVPQAARSMALKKPLIVRKKYGHHTLFRDSEEEKALTDSHETTCARQVKVKLCDEDRKVGSLRSHITQDSDIHMSEDDVKHSIKMAKEAVETLQRDLKKMDHNTAMKLAQESETDTELHEDIETARKALEHIHKNFGNLESMNLHTTAARDSETMQNVHITIAKTSEERMAQWKEAMANIQKNVEIARNIEDSFKAANQQDSMMLEQTDLETEQKEHKLDENVDSQLLTNGDSQMRVMEQTPLNHEEKEIVEDKLLNQEANQHLNSHIARELENTEDDMKTSPSTIIETQGEVKNNELLRSEGQEIHTLAKTAEEKSEKTETHHMSQQLEHENMHSHQHHHHHHLHHHQEKSSEMKQDMSIGQTEHLTSQLPTLKVSEESLDTKLARENVPESEMLVHTITNNNIKPTSDSLKEHPRSVEQLDVTAEQHLDHGKNALDTSDDMIDFLAKSAEHSKNDVIASESVLHETQNVPELGKTAEVSKLDEVKIMVPQQVVETEEKKIDNTPKSSENVELGDLQETATHNEDIMIAKSADHTLVQDQHKGHMVEHMIENVELPHLHTHTAAKQAEELLHNLDHAYHIPEWPAQKPILDHVSPKNEESTKGLGTSEGHVISEHETNHARGSYIPEHIHVSNRGFAHEYEMSSHGQHQMHPYPMRHHHNVMTHSNMHEMNGFGGMHSNYHPGMRDAMEGLGSEHNFRWKPTHESARGAYGGGLSGSLGGPGAVGVFPTANTGGCGIPLLLSCSPSVVSGSLAKPHSIGEHGIIGGSFGGPSYRNEEEFGFHNKRDIKKTNDLRTANTLRTTSIIKQKSPILLENKQ